MESFMKRDNNIPEIDFVITWVDGNDPVWQKQKMEYSGQPDLLQKQDDRKERYRDWDMLQYWFRGVERFAPWVHRIHFITWGHLPFWLNQEHPKLNIVNHKDFIPEKYLPTFNSHAIEWNMHRIPGLAENFVYFNDDMFLINYVRPEQYFKNGLPVDMLALQPDVANTKDQVMPYVYLNNTMLLAKYFNKRENIKKQPGAYFHPGYPPMYFIYNMLELVFPLFTGFYTVHGPSPLKKSTFEKMWELEPELLDEVCSHKFRQKEDVSQYVLREYQKLTGEFVPQNIKKLCQYYDISNDNTRIVADIIRQKSRSVCLNDSNQEIDFERAKEELHMGFAQILKEKSAFEK